MSDSDHGSYFYSLANWIDLIRSEKGKGQTYYNFVGLAFIVA